MIRIALLAAGLALLQTAPSNARLFCLFGPKEQRFGYSDVNFGVWEYTIDQKKLDSTVITIPETEGGGVTKKRVYFPLNGGEYNRFINFITVGNMKSVENGGYVTISDGGLRSKYVELTFHSLPGESMKFGVAIYGKPERISLTSQLCIKI